MAKRATPRLVDTHGSKDPVVMKAAVLDSQRATTLSLIAGTMKWCRDRMASLDRDLQEPHANGGPVDTSEAIHHLARLQGLTFQLYAQNRAMLVLHELATEWPRNVEVTVPALTVKS